MKQRKSKPETKSEQRSTTSSILFKVILTNAFMADANSLKKKYPNIKDDFLVLKGCYQFMIKLTSPQCLRKNLINY